MMDSDSKIYSVRFSVAIHVRRDPNAPRKGNDFQYSMTIDFMEAVFGKETEIEIPKEETCDTCDGSGAKKGTSPKTCSHCGGSGQISVTQNTPLGQNGQSSSMSSLSRNRENHS